MIRLFRVFIPSSIVGLVVSESLLVLAIYLLAIAWQMSESFWLYLQYENGALRVGIIAATIVIGLYLSDCYGRVRLWSRLLFLQQLCVVIGVAFLLQAFFSYSELNIRMPRQSMLAGSTLCLMLLPLWRMTYSKLSLEIRGAEKVLFLGTDPLQMVLAEHLREHPEFGMRPIGFLVEEDAALPEGAEDVLGKVSNAIEKVRKHKPDRIVVGLRGNPGSQGIQQVIHLKQNGYRAEELSEMFQIVFGRLPVSQLQPTQVLQRNFTPSTLQLHIQTAYSWPIALVATILFSPVMIATAIAVRFSSPGPVLYRQVRTGRNNVPFTIYKFRSMVEDSEAGTGAVWASENDPRVTPLGRLLRKYRLDELPQLFNVLKGEMAIVGPRPERPEFIQVLAAQIPYYMQRLAVKPGITGWAQINFRYGNSIPDAVIKLEYDLYYIRNFSPQLDFFVLFHTAKTMLLTRGAY